MELPILLYGPIIRRVEPEQVYIWVALSKRYTVYAELYTITPQNKPEEIAISADTATHSALSSMNVHKRHVPPPMHGEILFAIFRLALVHYSKLITI
jgi:hypothetical protein